MNLLSSAIINDKQFPFFLSYSVWSLSLSRSLTFSCSLSLHCMSHSRAPLPFDWEVNGKELEKPTEDLSTKKKHW